MNLQAGWISTYFAPTQSLLQKWLREKHKIHIYVTPYENKEYDVAQKNYNENINFLINDSTIIDYFKNK